MGPADVVRATPVLLDNLSAPPVAEILTGPADAASALPVVDRITVEPVTVSSSPAAELMEMPPALTIEIALDAAVRTTTPVNALIETPAAADAMEMGPPEVVSAAPILLDIERAPPVAEILTGPADAASALPAVERITVEPVTVSSSPDRKSVV